MKTQKAKGNKHERETAKRLSESLKIELRRNPGSGNMDRWKGDIIPVEDEDRIKFPFTIECKNQKRLQIPKWIEQVEKEAKEMGKAPVLIFHIYGTSKEYAMMDLDHWEKLAKKAVEE